MMLPLRFPALVALALLGAFAALLRGEEAFTSRVWETDDGMPHNGINAILRRRDGFLWVGTQGGLVRLDGMEILQRRSPLLANPRSSRVVELIEEDPSTLLVACDASGLVRLSQEGFSVHPLSESIGGGTRILSLFHESTAVFWVMSSDRRLWRWNRGRVMTFPAPDEPNTNAPGSIAMGDGGEVFIARGKGLESFKDGLLATIPDVPWQMITISPTSGGGIWIASPDAVWRREDGRLEQLAASTPWSSAPPSALLEDRDGALWVGSKAHGLFRWVEGDFHPVATSHPRLTALHADHEGNIWAGTSGGGLNLIQHARFRVLGENAGWTPAIDGGVCEDAVGRLWFANSGGGLRRVEGGRIQAPPALEGWPTKAIAIYPDPEGDLWVGSNNQLYRIDSDLRAPPQRIGIPDLGRVHVVHVTRDGTAWVGGEGGLLASIKDGQPTLHDASHGYTGVQAQAICEDSRGAVWIGTEEGSLFEKMGERFVRRELPPRTSGSGIRAMLADKEGDIWIGTGGGGLLVGQGGEFSVLSDEHGLPDNTISQLIEDDFGALWFGTSRALFKATKAELLECAAGKIAWVTSIKYGKHDGLAGFSAAANYQPSTWKTRDGRLLFVSRKGLVITSPGQQPMERSGPRVHIEKFTVDGRHRLEGDTRIPSGFRKLDVQFTAPTFISPGKIRFRYRLSGLESEWNESGTVRSASYARLAPGKYRFEVIACNSDLVWNPEAAMLHFEVVPVWWETWWARSLGVLAAVWLLTSIVRYWSHQRLKKRLLELEATRRIDIERTRIARDLHDGLGAGLTQIGMMAEELAEDVAELEEMKTYSSRIAGRVRGLARDLDAAVWTVSPKNDTLAALASYIGQYAIEYFRETPVRCRVNIPQDVPNTPLSPDVRHHLFLMAKEILNNVLKHSGASRVTLSVHSEGDRFHLGIEDDGHGFAGDSPAPLGGHGLKNIRERVRELGGNVVIRSSPSGTSIVIELPCPES
jgi:signal transduction histidine kinase/ligand-binding sensor domain-containing protein